MRSKIRIQMVFLAVAILMVAAGRGRSDVLLNEILADPASDWNGDTNVSSRDDEWVEIVNTGPGTVDLSGYRLAGLDGSWRYAFHGLLGEGQVHVIYGSESYAWEVASGNPAYGLRLTNSGSTIALWHLTATDTTMVDCHAYEDHEAFDDRSGGRFPDGGPAWKLFDGLNPYDGVVEPLGTGCAASPGESNACPTPVEPTTWGRIKALETR